MVVSCGFNSLSVAMHLTPQMAPYEIGVEIPEITANESGDSALREDMAYPELHYADKQPRQPANYSTSIYDSTRSTRSEFPAIW